MEETEEKLCANCKYFKQHYINSKGDFKETCCGHCIKRSMSLERLKRQMKDKTHCGFWEKENERKAKRERYVLGEVTALINLLEDYLQLLKIEK